jgi:hypothetical protein
MPPRQHLSLHRLKEQRPRRKQRFPGFALDPDYFGHARRIGRAVEQVIKAQAARTQIPGIDPELILKVNLSRPVAEDEWRKAGFTVIAQNPGNVFVLFADNRDLKQFREKLEAFQNGPREGAKTPPNAGLIGSILNATEVLAEDRIGPHLQASSASSPTDIDGRTVFIVDIELWDAGPQERTVRVSLFTDFIQKLGAECIGEPFITSQGLMILRARMRGTVLRQILDRPEVALVDLSPLPDIGEKQPPSLTVKELPPRKPPPDGAPSIGVIDSGVSAHPLLEGVLAESFGVPASLGSADEWGHGTKVSGIAIYGDIRECIDENAFNAPVRLVSARVVNAQGCFDDTQKLPEQIRNAVNALADRGCRVINMSLGDKSLIPYAGGRASAWASTLDTIASERDLVIVVSVGNAKAPWGPQLDSILTSYPNYLTSPENRLIDPAIAANVITVGALAHANGLRDDPNDGPQVQPVADRNQPSPISRCGPGIGNAIKPDFCDYGGTLVFNGHTNRLIKGEHWASAGVLSLAPDYRQSLFTGATGTSYAAPRIAYKAALIVSRYPTASANLIRALLGIAANIPPEAIACLQPAAPDSRPGNAVRHCLGYGMPELGHALSSDDFRVILLADRQEIELDQVALFAVPVPENFRKTKGDRTIRVALAFDPPVRHTRLEYLGARMSFYLFRGMTPEQILDQLGKIEKNDDAHDSLDTAEDDFEEEPGDKPGATVCKMFPGIKARETSTLQCATFNQAKNKDKFGDIFYIAVRSHRRWANEEIVRQRFALTVELRHDACSDLYQRCSDLNIQLTQRLTVHA